MTPGNAVVVIGAGISGLVAARELEKKGMEVRLFEGSDRLGGCVRTIRDDGYVFEAGPNSFPSSSTEIFWLAKDLGIEKEIIGADPASKKRLIYYRGRLMNVPTGPGELIKTRLFTPWQKIRMIMEPLIKAKKGEEPETIAEFFTRRFGLAPTRTLVDAFCSGIYAGDARRLDVEAAFPMLVDMERRHGSVMKGMGAKRKQGAPPLTIHSFTTGMEAIIEAAAASLKRKPVTRAQVRKLERCEGGYRLAIEVDGRLDEIVTPRVVVGTPGEATRRLLETIDPFVEDILCELVYAPLLVCHAAFDAEELKRLPFAFGYLVPRPQRVRTLGWLFSSRIFAGRAPEGKHAITGYIGGASDPTILNAGEEAVRHIMLGELSVALRMRNFPKPEFFRIIEQRPGIPQYTIGHRRRIAALRNLIAQNPGLALVGSYLDGVSLNECIAAAKRAVAELLEPKAAVAEAAS